MTKRKFATINCCYADLEELARRKTRMKMENYLRRCDIKTINTVILITAIGRCYIERKIRKNVLHAEKVLYKWSKRVCISDQEPEEHAIAYLVSKKDFVPCFLYGMEKLTYNLMEGYQLQLQCL